VQNFQKRVLYIIYKHIFGGFMRNIRFLLPVFGAVLVFMTGCIIHFGDMNETKGNGRVVVRERSIEQFDSITLNGVGKINIYPGQKYNGESYKVVVTTDSNIQEIIEVKVKSGCLYIDYKNNFSLNPTKLVLDVYLPELKEVCLSGVGDIFISNGNANSLDISLSGVGNINALNYLVKNIDIQLSGVGDARIWATQNLSGRLSGIGDIVYKGNPTNNIKVNGIGKVRRY